MEIVHHACLRQLVFCLIYALALCDLKVIANKGEHFANQWAVYMEGGLELANKVAFEHGFINIGPVGLLQDVYLFTHRAVPRRHRRSTLVRNKVLERDMRIKLVVQQKINRRVKRDASVSFTDSRWKDQWYLHRTEPGMVGHDMNILPAWKQGITGKNVVVTILDDGIEYTHRELRKNYDKNASYDYNDNDPDPQPKWALENSRFLWNRHGTRCAAQVAAEANNSHCIVGVAFNAKIGGIRMLDGDVTDAVEARSLMHRRDYIDIYSASWGPEDDGLTVDGPGNLTRRALEEGVLHGRGGKGSIFVWASGNGGNKYDDCNCDGYTNSIYTISAAATTSYGQKPWYLEECASTLISSYGTGDRRTDRKIVTADLNGGCTYRHSGTSVAAPFVAGFVALALEANPKLTWRDVQHLLVETAKIENLSQSNVRMNGAKKKFSPTFGFGVLDGGALVNLAKKWSLVSDQHVCKTPVSKRSLRLNNLRRLSINIETTGCKGTRNVVRYLEHVHVIISLVHSKRGQVSIYLVSPMKTRSRVLSRRKKDYKEGLFTQWAFLSTHFWGENPLGQWKLEIHSQSGNGFLQEWQLVLYGSEFAPGEPFPDIKSTGFVPGKEGVKCHAECLDGCIGVQPYECNNCRNYKVIDGNRTCVEHCPGNYFTDEISMQCLPCHESCWSCTGPNSNECSSCKAGKSLHQSKCADRCPQDYFKSPYKIGLRCLKCDGSCLRCRGSAENCTHCRPEDVLVENHCYARCDHESFFDGVNCIKCHSSCHTCNGETENNCTSCRYKGLHGNINHKTTYLYKGSCLPKCPMSYYNDQFKGICEPCGKDCIKCEKEGEKCLTCRHGYYKMPNNPKECVEKCPQGTFPDLLLGICISCSHNCHTCLPGHRHDCASCGNMSNGQAIYLKQSRCDFEVNCGLGFFANKSSGRCDVCPFPCTTCDASENCQNCFNPYVNFNDEKCIDECPSGTYRDMDRKCMNCHLSCKECYGPGAKHCLRCHKGIMLSGDNSCSWFCPLNGYYRDEEAQLCKPCDPACSKCYGPNVNQCTRCIKNLDLRGTTCVQPCVDNYLTENSCEPCHPHCKTCFGPEATECLSCYANKTLFGYQCRHSCPHGYYQDRNFVCRPCHNDCATCNGKGLASCTSCSLGLSFLDGKCVRKCPKGYFQQDDRCLKCSSNCAECQFSEDICMHCKEGKVWRDFGCHDSCGVGLFVFQETRRCHMCHHSCRTCFGFDANQCLSCPSGMVLYNSMCFEECPARYVASAPTSMCNSCPENCLKCNKQTNYSVCELCRHPHLNLHGKCVLSCPESNYYHDFYSKSCKRCHESCEVCYGPSQSDCNKCKSNFILVENRCVLSNCSRGSYLDSKTLKCQQCHSKCNACFGPSSKDCIECHGEYVLHENDCILGCKDGSYPNEKIGRCSFCDPTCKSCLGPSSANCTGCKKDHTLINGNCVLGCQEGRYPDAKIGVCKDCHSSCRSCSGPEESNCTACRRHHTLLEGTCVLSCADGTFPNNTLEICQKCDNVCKTCDGPTTNNCTTCERDFTLVAGTCVLDCPGGSYPDPIAKKCQHCNALCKSCNGPKDTDCTSCKKEFVLIGTKCMLNCNDGSYPDETVHQCRQCSDKCKTCNGASEMNCTACHKEYTLIDNKCVLDCPQGKFADERLEKCRHCSTLCKTCNGASSKNCTSCKRRHTLLDGSCILFCNEGFYPEKKLGRCLPCHERCKSCNGRRKSQCNACHEGYILENNECVPECLNEYYYDKATDSCSKCIDPCTTCYGPKITECTACKSEYNLVENTCFPLCRMNEYLDDKSWQCRKCDQSCLTCFGPYRSNCTKCKDEYILFYDTCFMACTDGHFPDYKTGKCVECDKKCITCMGPTDNDCLSCKKNYALFDSTCVIDCQEGTYADERLGKCQKCHDTCMKCNGPSLENCISCHQDALLINNTCIPSCQSGFYFDSSKRQCLKCNEICQTCDGPSAQQCVSCRENETLIDKTCMSTCSHGSYPNHASRMCMPCSDKCLSCIGPAINNCTSCLDGFLLQNNTCVSLCQDGTYFATETMQCESCPTGCATCENSSHLHCISCKEPFALSKGKCELICEGGTYLDKKSQKCFSCNDRCLSCNGPTESNCLECKGEYFQHGFSCVLKCPSGTYEDRENSMCKACHQSCKECIGPNDRNCSFCSGTLLLENNKCVLHCEEGTYIDNVTRRCVPCSKTCRTCNGAFKKNCTSCFNADTLIDNECVKNCILGTFLDEKSRTCVPCGDLCESCTGPKREDCTSCVNGHYLHNSSCYKECPRGHYGIDRGCNACHSTCDKCSGPAFDDCTSCGAGNFLQDNVCMKSCSDGAFPDPIANKCSSCHQNCRTCDGPKLNDCLSCSSNMYLEIESRECINACKVGFFRHNDTCIKCNESCYSCDGESAANCLSCFGNLALYNSSCVEECPTQHYKITMNNSSFCYPCFERCKECSGAKEVDCISCVEGFYLQDGNCTIACSDTHIANNESYTCERSISKKPILRTLKEFKEIEEGRETVQHITHYLPTRELFLAVALLGVCLVLYRLKSTIFSKDYKQRYHNHNHREHHSRLEGESKEKKHGII